MWWRVVGFLLNALLEVIVVSVKELWNKWTGWSHEHRLAAISTYVTIASFIFAVFTYFVPLHVTESNGVQHNSSLHKIQKITIPITISNQLRADAHIDPIAEFYLLVPESPFVDVTIDSGLVRLERPEKITTLNGNYPINENDEIYTRITFPKSEKLSSALNKGGYKLRLIVRDTWVFDHEEFVDVLFDKTTLNEGIRVVLYQESAPNK